MSQFADVLTSGEGLLIIAEATVAAISRCPCVKVNIKDIDDTQVLLGSSSQSDDGSKFKAGEEEERYIKALAKYGSIDRCVLSASRALKHLRDTKTSPSCLQFMLIALPQAIVGPLLYYA